MTNLSKWFGYPIYISKIKNYEEINKEILPYLKENVTATNSQYSRTTDIKAKDLQSIDDNLHTDERFDKLFKEIQQVIIAALDAQHYNLELFELYITKSWATYSEKNQFISTHEHVASVYSFVYYVQINKDHSPLTFYEPQQKRFYMPDSSEWNDANHQTVSILGEPGMLLVFPSHVFHGTEK